MRWLSSLPPLQRIMLDAVTMTLTFGAITVGLSAFFGTSIAPWLLATAVHGALRAMKARRLLAAEAAS